MAFDYNGSSDVSKSTGSPVSATAFTLAGWIYSDTTSGSRYAFGLQNSSSNQGWRIGFNSTALILQCTGSGTQSTQSAGNAGTGSWMHLGMVCSSATSRALYKNGSSLATGTNSLTPSGVNEIRIGAGTDSSGNATSYWDGGISLVGLWSAALTTAEMGELASGQHPFLVRPASLVALYLDASTAVTTGSHIGGYALDGVFSERAQRPAVFFPGWSGGKRAAPVANSYTLTCTSQTATGTSNSATLTTARLLTATARTATGTSNAATLKASRLLTATSRTATGTVQAATLSADRLLTATSTTATATVQSATLTRTKILTCTSRSAAGTANDATLVSARKIVATTATATGSSNSATIAKGYSLTLSSGSATATVQDATLRKASLLECVVNAAIATAHQANLSSDQVERATSVDVETVWTATERPSTAQARSRIDVAYAVERLSVASCRQRTGIATAIERVT